MNWDDRYSSTDYAYGTEPNDFLVGVVDNIPVGRILCIAEGEGRNAVFLASRGYDVVAVDSSSVGLKKAQLLAAEKSVSITTIQANLSDYKIQPETYTGIISIYGHLPLEVRKNIHSEAVRGLCSGGVFILEAFTKEQLNHNTGGPKDINMLMSLTELKDELSGMDLLIAREITRDVQEGIYHTGLSAVVQIMARKP